MLTASESCSKFTLVGVSTVGGNVEIPKCTINARKVMKLANFKNTNVYPGSSKPLVRQPRFCQNEGCSGLDGTTTLGKIKLPEQNEEEFGFGRAIKAMYKTLMSTPKGSCWMVCTGPLTNAAVLFATYGDEIVEHLAGLCFMGGAI